MDQLRKEATAEHSNPGAPRLPAHPFRGLSVGESDCGKTLSIIENLICSTIARASSPDPLVTRCDYRRVIEPELRVDDRLRECVAGQGHRHRAQFGSIIPVRMML